MIKIFAYLAELCEDFKVSKKKKKKKLEPNGKIKSKTKFKKKKIYLCLRQIFAVT